jgi:hypothetical protein
MIKELGLEESKMIGDPVILDKCIFYYENAIDFADNLRQLCIDDARGWKINNEDATSWEPGKKILGYDEYEVNFSFDSNYQWIKMGKSIWDIAKNYSSSNFTTMFDLERPVIRRYPSKPGFFELESADQMNPSRKFSSILFLNNCDDGGDVSFKQFDLSVRPKEGSALLFPSSFAYSFKINRPKDGENFILISHFI